MEISALSKMSDNNSQIGGTVDVCSTELLEMGIEGIPTLTYGLTVTLCGKPNTLATCITFLESVMKADKAILCLF